MSITNYSGLGLVYIIAKEEGLTDLQLDELFDSIQGKAPIVEKFTELIEFIRDAVCKIKERNS